MVREAVVYRAHGADVSRVMTTPKDELAGIVKADSLFFRFNSVHELKLPDLGDVLVMRGDTRFVAQKQNVILFQRSMVIHDDDEAFNIFQGKPVPGSGWEDVSFFAEEMDVYVTYLLIAVDNTLGIEDRSLTQRVPFRQRCSNDVHRLLLRVNPEKFALLKHLAMPMCNDAEGA
ncbi:unnamed protein product [Durusdinium trenchii]|uniref:Uncharacterized protein n=1 Tax=Durusdinium trenchii TaxID=1381693 RepID=A0ABP0R7T8_9DINO